MSQPQTSGQRATFFQFPLCCLAFGKDTDERLNGIIGYAYVEAGRKIWNRLPQTARQQRLEDWKSNRSLPKGFDFQNPVHLAALCGADCVEVSIRDIDYALRRYQAVGAFIGDFQQRHGTDPLVRIKKDWLFKVRDGHGITYREFAVLCAIYSALGDKDLALVTRERIRHCALGYKTAAIMKAELCRRSDSMPPLTERRLKDTLARLHRNKFFARCTVGRRFTYYSIRMDGETLRKRVLKRHTYAGFFRASQAAQDQALDAAIHQRRIAGQGPLANPPQRLPAILDLRHELKSERPDEHSVHSQSEIGPLNVHSASAARPR